MDCAGASAGICISRENREWGWCVLGLWASNTEMFWGQGFPWPRNNTNIGLDCVGTELWDNLSAVPGGRLDLIFIFFPFLALRNMLVWSGQLCILLMAGSVCAHLCQFSSAWYFGSKAGGLVPFSDWFMRWEIQLCLIRQIRCSKWCICHWFEQSNVVQLLQYSSHLLLTTSVRWPLVFVCLLLLR